ILLVSHAGGPARLFQIPAGTLSLAVSNGRRVINLAGNHHEVGPLGDHQAVAGANLNIHRRVLPFLNRCADVDKQAPTGRKLPGLVDELLPLACSGRTLKPRSANALLLQAGHHFVTALGGELTNFSPLQNCTVGISLRRESAGSTKNRAQLLTTLNAIAAGMHDFAINGDGAADVVPAAYLADSQYVTRFQDHVGIQLTGQGPADGDGAMFKLYVVAVHNGVAGKIGFFLVRIALEAPCHTQQVGSAHTIRKRILTRTQHLAVNRNLGSIDLIASEDADGIEWLQSRSRRALLKNFTQVEADYSGAEV